MGSDSESEERSDNKQPASAPPDGLPKQNSKQIQSLSEGCGTTIPTQELGGCKEHRGKALKERMGYIRAASIKMEQQG